jgi:hypothetical protein
VPQRMKKFLFVVAIDAFLLMAGAGMLELYLRFEHIPPYVRTYPGQHLNEPLRAPWLQPDDYFGWISNTALPDINPQGFRDPRSFNDLVIASDRTRIMVLGDSFMWGAQLDATESVPQQLQRALGDRYEVFNLGVPGWGIDQMYLGYERYVSVLHPDVVILAYIDDDVARVLEAYRAETAMTKPSFAIVGDELARRESTRGQQRLSVTLGKSVLASQIARAVYMSAVARRIVCTVFKKIADDTAHRGVRFAVVRIPNKEQERLWPRVAWRWTGYAGCLSKTDVPYLEPLDDMLKVQNWHRDFYLEDGHTSSRGNQFLARWLLSRMSFDAKR